MPLSAPGVMQDQKQSIIVKGSNANISTIPLPFASLAFSDSYHAALMKNLGINGAVLMFARATNSLYSASAIGLNKIDTKCELELSAFCSSVTNDLIHTNGHILPIHPTLSGLPSILMRANEHEYRYLRIYKINDFLASEGYWIMFFKHRTQANAIDNTIKESITSPQFRETITETVASAMRSEAIDEVIANWVTLLDKRDKETEIHTVRVAHATVSLGQRLGLKNEDLDNLRRGALLHDVGKLIIPNEILFKPGKLTDSEWIIMRMHPTIVKDLLNSFSLPSKVLEIPFSHHEKWDGSGYSQNLAGEDIPLSARIFAIVDVFDALVSDRPYRPRFPREEVLKYIKNQAGRHFDPHIVPEFLTLADELDIGRGWI
jgi:putative nucleotidyltransferase with HDIG domain